MSDQGEAPASGVEQSRLAALGKVAGELMHDLANMLAVLKGEAAIALEDARSGRLPVGDLERMAESSDEMAAMLRDVMETLKGEAVSPEVVFDPRTMAGRVIRRLLGNSQPLRIHLSCDLPAAVLVRGRSSFFTRALANLLGNAARHARSEIRVSLTLSDLAGSRPLLVRVEDDGPGVAGGQAETMFLPLVHGETGGLGLGLSSVSWAITNLRGEIGYQRGEVLGGACFEIRLPLAGRRQYVSTQAVQSLVGHRLLLVEDDPVVSSALVRLLGRMGAEPVAFFPVGKNDEELLHELLRSMPDVILMDIRLGSHRGVSIWRMLHTNVPELARRVVFLSGLGAGDPDWEDARNTGRPVLAKPLDLNELAAAVAEVVNG